MIFIHVILLQQSCADKNRAKVITSHYKHQNLLYEKNNSTCNTDGSYIMSEANIEETNHVKKFDRFIVDVKNILAAKKERQKE